MIKHTRRRSRSGPIGFVLLGLVGLGVFVAVLLRGADVALFNPKGLIAGQQSSLIMLVVGLMLLVAVPTLILLYSFAWRFRESNKKAVYSPHARHSKFFVLGLWAIPTITVLVLASMMWPATHRLEPRKLISADAKPLTIQVIALRWKWLFIYPQQNIATVNYVQVPVGTPVQFLLTADEAPMSSFWIPNLGGQLYAMTGHSNQLNLMADTPGDYPGSSAEINGAGFAGMKFIARASSGQDFDAWVHEVQQSSSVLDAAQYQKLLKPSENNPGAVYASPQPDLYDTVLMKYMGSHHHGEHE